jgi:serine/threonine protein kinase
MDSVIIPNENIQKYAVLGWIGQGSLSVVYKAEDPTQLYDSPLRCIALKRLPADCKDIGSQESVVLSLFKKSKYIVDHYGSFYMGGQMVLAFELLDWRRTLSLSPFNVRSPDDHIKGASDIQVTLAKIALQLLLAVKEMHDRNFIHADIKPSNIMFQFGHKHKIKLIDLGNAVEKQMLSKYHGDFELQSLSYRAPEVLLGDAQFSEKIDIWSIGVVLFELFTNALFKSHENNWIFIRDSNRKQIVTTITTYIGPLDFYKGRGAFWHDDYSDANVRDSRRNMLRQSLSHSNKDVSLLANFLLHLLNVNHFDRPSANQALQHPFLKQKLLGSWGSVLFQ